LFVTLSYGGQSCEGVGNTLTSCSLFFRLLGYPADSCEQKNPWCYQKHFESSCMPVRFWEWTVSVPISVQTPTAPYNGGKTKMQGD
jgi:hypothetical protein